MSSRRPTELRTLAWKPRVAGLALALSALGSACGGPDGSGDPGTLTDTGNVELALKVADGIELDTVYYEITGNGFSKSGDVPVSRSGTLRIRVGGIPVGEGYLITLRAEGAEEVTCEGSEQFDVSRGRTTSAHVTLMCRVPGGKGSVLVTGEFNVCPVIDGVTVLPEETEVGGAIQFAAEASDSDEAPTALSYEWTASSGNLGDASTPATEFVCTAPGVATVTLTVSDGACEESVAVPVTCTEPDGGEEEGEAVLVWNEVESNGGTPDDWAELYNAGDASADLSNWVFKDNDDTHVYAVPAGTTIAPGEYLVLEGYGFGLGSPDSVRLFDAEGALVTSFSWDAHAPTTYGRCPDMSGEFGITTASTKGGPNDCTPEVVVNEVESSGGAPDDWVELYNAGLNAVDLGGWVLKDNDDTHAYVVEAGTLLAPGAYLVLDAGDAGPVGFGLGGADSVRLFDSEMTLVDSHTWSAHAATTYARCPNGGGDFGLSTLATKGGANACDVSIEINEIESSGGSPGDWVELINTGSLATDISGWFLKDDNDSRTFAFAPGTVLAPGALLVVDEATFGFGLGGADMVRIFDANGVLVDSYAYESHAAQSYGRCPDGSGDFADTSAVTKGTPNTCPVDPDQASVWPGGSESQPVDPAGTFASNLSGLHYEPESAGGPAVLWAALNGPSKVYRLVYNGSEWAPAAGDWSDGKLLVYPNGTGGPDSESLTRGDWGQPGLYVSTERDNSASGTSRLSVLRFDETSSGTTLVASHEWNLTGLLPSVGANAGLEGITWLPDSFLVERGFIDPLLNQPYAPAAYPDHGAGLFLVGVEGTGALHLLALDHASGAAHVLATLESGHPNVMALEFDRETGLLWAGCDDTCGNETTVLKLDAAGALAVSARFARPTGLPNVNNEGIAFMAEATCVGGFKGIFWSDDNDTDGHALRLGSIPCGSFF